MAYWQSKVIEIFKSIQSSVEVVATSPVLSSVVRSLLFFQATSADGDTSPTFIIAGLADGSLVHFQWTKDGLLDMKTISLGAAPVSLTVCPVDGSDTIFATGSRSLILSWEKKRLRSSPILLKDIAVAATLHAEDYPETLVLATSHGLSIGRVRQLDRLHIRSVISRAVQSLGRC